MAIPTIKELFEAGVHFGHRTQRWNPKMKPYIFEARHGIYLIDLEHTHEQLRTAINFLTSISRKGERVLFVGCKKSAQQVVKEIASRANCPYVADRWLGGTLTNLLTIRKSVKRLEFIENLEKSPEGEKVPKQEMAVLRREKTKLLRNLSGIRGMEKLPGALVIVDILRETNALAEAKRLGIPVLALVDTNADPTQVDYPIASNDDAIRSIRILLEALAQAITDGEQSEGGRKSNRSQTSSGKKEEDATLQAVSA